MKQKEDLTLFGVFLFRIIPTVVVLGLLCGCLYLFVLPNLNGLLTSVPSLPSAPATATSVRAGAANTAVPATPTSIRRPTITASGTAGASTAVPATPAATNPPLPVATAIPLPSAAPNVKKLLWGVVDFPSYDASIGAVYFGPQNGVEIQVVNLTGQKESDLCKWLLTDDGQLRLLFDTPNSPVAHVDDFWSFHTQGANFLMVDGSVRTINNSINPVTWWALGTRAGGEPVSVPE